MEDNISFKELALGKIDDYFDYTRLMEKHEKEVESRAKELAVSMAEELFTARKDEFQLQVLEQLQNEGIRKEGLKISTSSSLISETFTVDGMELNPADYVPDSVSTDPLYEENQLIKNAYSLEWQEVNRNTGKMKFVSFFNPTSILIANPKGIGCCETIIVTLKGERTPLVFPNGDISYEEFRKQTRFARKGLKTDVKVVYESFLRAMRECPNKLFLTIPNYAGWVKLQSGESIYISYESVIPGLEELFPAEVKEHKLLHHDLSLETVSPMYRKALPDCMEAKLLTAIRTSSCLLPFFEAEGLRPDRAFALVYNSESAKEVGVALTKRKNYTTTVIQTLTDRIIKVRRELETSNDVTVLLSFAGLLEDKRAIDNGLREILWELNRENGVENNTRKVVVLLTDSPGTIPEDFPVYYLSCDFALDTKNIEVIQRLSGMLDYALIEFAGRNPDTIEQLIRKGIKFALGIVISFKNTEVTNSMIMTLATAHILSKLHIISDIEMQSIIHWFRTEATSRSTMTDVICREFKSAVSSAILSGELTIAKQYGPPYYSSDDHTAFIAENDRSINMDDDVVNNVIIPKLHTRSVVKMNKHLNGKGLLKGKHTNKRKLKVAYDAGVLEDVEVFSYSRSVLNAEAKAYVDDIIDNEYWFNVGEYPDGFVPVLYNADGTRAAGYVFNPDMDDNFHEVYFGATRSGKTFALVNRALQKVIFEGADAVIIFDQTGGFTPTEIDKHVGKELRENYFSFWNIYDDGLPVDLLDLRGCQGYKDKKDRLTRIFAMMCRTLGSYEEQIIKNAVKDLLKEMKFNPDVIASDIEKYIYNEDDAHDEEEPSGDKTHRKLRYKIDAVLDDLRDTPQIKNNWGEFAKAQGKHIIVISTGADGVEKGSEIIDIMLEILYGYKQCHPYEKYTVVIDEAQDLYLHEKGAVNTLLRKGGKHGVTMLLASQSYPDSTTPFGKVVGNCGRVRGYRSKGDDLARYADRFGCDKYEADSLQKGNCFDKGPFYSRYRCENVITTLKGRTVVFEHAPNNDKNDDEQPCGCSEGGENDG